jgi:hypothetical protein
LAVVTDKYVHLLHLFPPRRAASTQPPLTSFLVHLNNYESLTTSTVHITYLLTDTHHTLKEREDRWYIIRERDVKEKVLWKGLGYEKHSSGIKINVPKKCEHEEEETELITAKHFQKIFCLSSCGRCATFQYPFFQETFRTLLLVVLQLIRMERKSCNKCAPVLNEATNKSRSALCVEQEMMARSL